MNIDVFEKLSSQTKAYMDVDYPCIDECIDEIIAVFKKQRAAGLSDFAFSTLLVHIAFGDMMLLGPPKEAQAFARFTRDKAMRTCATLAEHGGPPLDPTKWPYV